MNEDDWDLDDFLALVAQQESLTEGPEKAIFYLADRMDRNDSIFSLPLEEQKNGTIEEIDVPQLGLSIVYMHMAPDNPRYDRIIEIKFYEQN